MKLAEHPTVKQLRERNESEIAEEQQPLNADWLRQLVLESGADDVSFVEIGRPALDDQRDDILKAFPRTQALVSFVVRMNRQRIVETAERLFYAEGVRAVGIDRIIAEAEVAKMTLYNHFASKDDLILAVLQYREEKFDAMFEKWMNKARQGGHGPTGSVLCRP